MKGKILKVVSEMGLLRILLAASALIMSLAMPWADVTMSPEGLGLLRGTVLPAAAPIVFMVLMLDLLMCQVLKIDAEQPRRRDLNIISAIYLVLGILLVLSWTPVFLQATYI
jgi:hypothetical protein